MYSLIPILSLLAFFILLRIYLSKVILPIAEMYSVRIMRWRIVGHFYNSSAIFKMLNRLKNTDDWNSTKYLVIMVFYVMLQLITAAALLFTFITLIRTG
jgi:hypothetical protein